MKKSFFMILLAALGNNAIAENNKSWLFDVYLDENLIGEHRFNILEDGKRQVIDISAQFDVKFLFFNAYQYKHLNKEIWQSQCLKSIDSVTDDNGKKYQVKGKQNNNSFQLTVNESTNFINGCVYTFSYWNTDILKQVKLLNSQTGEYEKVKTRKIGKNTIQLNEKSIAANQYRIDAKSFSVDLWYSERGEWLSLKSTTKDGNVLSYKLRSKI